MYLRFNSGMEDLMKYNKNASNSLFSERSAKNKVLIIVPHEDDETIIAGNIIDLLKLNGNDIKVAYLTNGDYSIPAEIRAKEAIHAIRTLGLNEDDVFFLGYPDTQFGENTSLIETTDKPYRSKAGKEYLNDYLFMFAWNEWGEGGYLEPDEKNEYKYLQAIYNALFL